MTSDAHPDSYAEGYHQGFFRNLQAGREPHNCGEKTPGTASIGGLVTVGPLAVLELLRDNSVAQVQQTVRNHLFLTHPDEQLGVVADAYVELLNVTLNQGKSEDARKQLQAAAAVSALVGEQKFDELALKPDREVVGKIFSMACPIESSWPSLLFLASKYFDQSPFEALKANALVGGDNVHRGAVLGTIVGALNPEDAAIAEHFANLVHAKEIDAEILAAVEAALQ